MLCDDCILVKQIAINMAARKEFAYDLIFHFSKLKKENKRNDEKRIFN